MMNKTIRMTAAALLVMGVGALPIASAKDGSDIRVAGKCTGSSTAKLKLSPENGKIEVEFEVDQNRVGRRWTYGLARNGRTVASGAKVTTAPSGSFEVRRVIANGPGADRVTARAVSPTGEVCTARATFA